MNANKKKETQIYVVSASIKVTEGYLCLCQIKENTKSYAILYCDDNFEIIRKGTIQNWLEECTKTTCFTDNKNQEIKTNSMIMPSNPYKKITEDDKYCIFPTFYTLHFSKDSYYIGHDRTNYIEPESFTLTPRPYNLQFLTGKLNDNEETVLVVFSHEKRIENKVYNVFTEKGTDIIRLAIDCETGECIEFDLNRFFKDDLK